MASGGLSRLVSGTIVAASAVVPVVVLAVAGLFLWRSAQEAQVARGQQMAATTATLLSVAAETRSAADLEVARAFASATVGDGDGDVEAVVATDPSGAIILGAVSARFVDAAMALRALEASGAGVVVEAAVTARDRTTRSEEPAGRIVVGLRAPTMPWRLLLGLSSLCLGLVSGVVVVATSVLRRRAVEPLEDLTQGLLAVAAGRINEGVAEIDGVRRPDIRPVREIDGLLDAFDAMVRGVRERQRLTSRLEQGLGAQVAADATLLEAPPRRLDVAVVVVDIRDFTALQASLRPEQVGAFVDAALTAFVIVVERHGGHVERFLGDGLIALFGAPTERHDAVVRATACALDLEQVSQRLLADSQQDGIARFTVGVGVACGSAVVGAVGPPKRRVYQAMGDVPALARKIQQEAKNQGLGVLVSEAVVDVVGDALPAVRFAKLPPMAMRGIGLPVILYRPERAARANDGLTALVDRRVV
jgi:class 3 adenylate cyclase